MATEMDNADALAVWGGLGWFGEVRLVSFRDIRHTYASYIHTPYLRREGSASVVLCWPGHRSHSTLVFSRQASERREGYLNP